jgi:hypothetical protein
MAGGMASNSVVEIKTVPLDGPEGPTVAMMLAVDIGDPKTAPAFVATIVKQFKLQRMLAPPQTSMLLVTLVGDLSADAFVEHWAAIEKRDAILHAFMTKMVVAEVVQGTPSGQQLSQASLVQAVEAG